MGLVDGAPVENGGRDLFLEKSSRAPRGFFPFRICIDPRTPDEGKNGVRFLHGGPTFDCPRAKFRMMDHIHGCFLLKKIPNLLQLSTIVNWNFFDNNSQLELTCAHTVVFIFLKLPLELNQLRPSLCFMVFFGLRNFPRLN
jgi:hypothetical protein